MASMDSLKLRLVKKMIYLLFFLTALSWLDGGCCPAAVCRLLIVVAALVAEHRF